MRNPPALPAGDTGHRGMRRRTEQTRVVNSILSYNQLSGTIPATLASLQLLCAAAAPRQPSAQRATPSVEAAKRAGSAPALCDARRRGAERTLVVRRGFLWPPPTTAAAAPSTTTS